MRILILGNSYSAKSFFELFEKDEKNIIFSTMPELKNYIDFKNTIDIVDFCSANEINFVLIIDEEYINLGLQEQISAMNISAFAPSIEAVGICSSKAFAKKFMHKNKIKTPKFQVVEKPSVALDYIKTVNFPQAVRPDYSSYRECTLFCETYKQAQEIINKFFASGNKKIIIEDYIEGRNISVAVLSDGYRAEILGVSAKYQDSVAIFEPDFINKDLKEKIYHKAIIPTITSLSDQGDEYIGILEFDFILTFSNELYLLGYHSFFDDMTVDFYTNGFDIDWIKVFDSTIVGDVFIAHEFEPKDEYMLTIRQNEEIKFISSKTKANLKRYLNELEFDLKEYNEAQKIWKY